MVRGRGIGGRVVGSGLVGRGRVVGSGLVGRCRVVGSRLVGGRLVLLGIALVPDIGNIARVGITNSVGHNLGAAIGKGNTVLAVGGIAVALLVGLEVGASVVISNSIAILVLGGLLLVGRGRVVGGGGVGRGRVVGGRGVGSGRGSNGGSHEGGEGKEGLKQALINYFYSRSFGLKTTFMLT